MKNRCKQFSLWFENLLVRLGIGMRAKLIILFLVVKVIPLILLAAIAWRQIINLGTILRDIAVSDSSSALNNSAVENIERMTTDTAIRVASFLYERDSDLLYLASIAPSQENYHLFIATKLGQLVERGQWELGPDGECWVSMQKKEEQPQTNRSTNKENDDMDGFHYRYPENFSFKQVPLYDEITYVDLNGKELIKAIAPDSTKKNFPMSADKKDISQRQNTYIRAEDYFQHLTNLKPGEIYVSDVIGAYVGSNCIGMYTPEKVQQSAEKKGYPIDYEPLAQAYAGAENPNGVRFEGIVRFATPVTDERGNKIGYVTFALNHDHLMEFVDHITPMNERYVELPSAYEGNYAFIWDYQCRNICHPRHHSIVGYDPKTGEPEIPWLEATIYEAWQASGVEKWTDFVRDWPQFDQQSRNNKPASDLTKKGLVGLDGRYLNNAPQCTGWMDLTEDGGSGSFYILWSGLYKLTTAAAIPYYTGQYAPSEHNNYSKRGFGIVTIGAGLDDFTRPAKMTEEKLEGVIGDNLTVTFMQLIATTAVIIILVVLIAIWVASFLTNRITDLIKGISRFRSGERQFRFHAPVKDEFGTLADSFDDMADSIVDSVKNPLTITDMNRKIIYMNDYGLKICKQTLPEIIGTSYGESSIYPANSNYCPITALVEGREADIYYIEETNLFIKGVANYLLNKDGKKIGYIVESSDMTEMVQEQIKIESQRTLLDQIFSASPDLIWYMDEKSKYLAVNPRFASIAGKSAEEFIGKTAYELFLPHLAQSFDENDQKAMASLTPLYSEERIAFADDHEEILESVRTPIFDTNGILIGLLGFARNVTIRVVMENELRDTQMELEQAVNIANRANEHKGEFLARMSHEIRTPMNAIIGITNIVLKKLNQTEDDVLAESEISDVKDHVLQIEASSQHLLGLLNDILDISKIEAGKIELAQETVELPRLVQTVEGIIKPRCDEKNLTFVTTMDFFEPTHFVCDPLRLRQVLINLLGNAVKFTPEWGTIHFQVRKKEQRHGRTLVEFSIQDTGIGIANEALGTIFQSFEQASSNISRKYGGTGLGLAISRRIVQLFGGELQVESTLGEGSTFYFSIWLEETMPDLADDRVIADMTDKYSDKRMLLVDDLDINRMIVISLLEHTGIIIDEADDGQMALYMFKNAVEFEYDIVFMDVMMPVMDGYEATEAIRALPREDAKQVPVIALTANAFQDDIKKAIEHGMDAHISKPIELERLLDVLKKYLG